MHQAEAYARKAVAEVGRKEYLREFLRGERDKDAVADVAAGLKAFSVSRLEPQQIRVKGFAVPVGSLALYQYLREELYALQQMLAEGKAEFASLEAAEKNSMEERFQAVLQGNESMLEELFARHVADQLEQRVDGAAAARAMREEGVLPLHLDEKTMGSIFNTLALQLYIDRFNVLFQDVAEPVDQELVNRLLETVFIPFWQENADGVLFAMK